MPAGTGIAPPRCHPPSDGGTLRHVNNSLPGPLSEGSVHGNGSRQPDNWRSALADPFVTVLAHGNGVIVSHEPDYGKSAKSIHPGFRSYATVASASDLRTAEPRTHTSLPSVKLSGEVGRASGTVSEEDDECEFTLATKKRRGAATRHERRFASGAILIGGSNVRRISSAARNEFDIDREMFRSVPGIVTEDVPSYVSNAVRKTGGKEMDVVFHVGGDDLAAERSVDYVLEGLANAI